MKHVTTDAIEQWHRGELSADEVLAVARHLAACGECRLLAEPRGVGRHVAAMRAQAEDLDHPDLETELFAYADGTLDPEQRARVNEHLAVCGICREDVADARAAARRPFRPGMRWVIAIAALVVLAWTGVLLLRPPRVEQTPRPRIVKVDPTPPPVHEAAGQAAAARRALVEAELVMPPILRELRGGEEILRGTESRGHQLTPAGSFVEERQPELSWDAPEGATSLVVLYAGEREIARSPLLRRTSWVPPPLERGVTYTWEVQIQTDGQLQIVPSPPAPPARFRVLDARAASELEAARREHAADPLLLGVLHARAGLEAQARAELARVGAAEREVARRHLRELDSWP